MRKPWKRKIAAAGSEWAALVCWTQTRGWRGEAASVVSKPPVVSRTGWSCPDGQGSRWQPQYTTVTHLVVHHSAGANTSGNWGATVRAIWDFHTRPVAEGGRGWGDIGYNYLIDPRGVIYEGRAGGDYAVAAHFSCRNGGTMGICLLGTYSTVSPSAAALESLKKLLAWKAAQRGFQATGQGYHAGTGLLLPRVCAHRDGNAAYPEEACTTTSCPGDRLYGLMPSIRAEVQARVENATALPEVAIVGATEVTDGTARLWGRVISAGGSAIRERRIEWGEAGEALTRWTTAVSVEGSFFYAEVGNLGRDLQHQFRVSTRNNAGWISSETDSFRTRTRLAVAIEDGIRVVTVSGQAGSAVQLERSTDLQEWELLSTQTIPLGGVLSLPLESENGGPLFYRASVMD